MAIYCGSCLGAICDFCRWYDFNGDTEGCYTGDGFCRLHRGQRDPGDACEHFHCRNAGAENRFSTPDSKTGRVRSGRILACVLQGLTSYFVFTEKADGCLHHVFVIRLPPGYPPQCGEKALGRLPATDMPQIAVNDQARESIRIRGCQWPQAVALGVPGIDELISYQAAQRPMKPGALHGIGAQISQMLFFLCREHAIKLLHDAFEVGRFTVHCMQRR
ncbi:MAG: hypothetical protein WCD66_14745 [Rhodanobacteraceae bacterium]